MPKIDFMRAEVKMQLGKWSQIRDCLGGAEAIKGKGVAYLPMPNAHDKSTENKERYKGYKQRAVFMNAVANTVEGLVGQVFSADPVVDLPESMKILIEDADGAGVTLAQVAKGALGDVLAYGREGMMVDFPAPARNEQGLERDFTRQEMADGTARPNLLRFAPDKVINWRTRMIGGKSVLSLVVIEMSYIAEDDGFEIKNGTEWRVLTLDAGNQYVCEVWRKTEAASMQQGPAEPFVRHAVYYPRNSAGQRLTYIPFTFIGSLNNDTSPDKPPMYDLSEINLAHYRNSADYEDSIYMVGQGTPVAVGLTTQWVKDVWKDKPMQLGARGIVPLPVNGDFKIVAMEPNSMCKEGMDQKEVQMAMMGAQLVEKQEVQRTLGEAKMEKAVIDSVLVQCAKNDAQAIQQCLKWAADFYGESPDKIVFELSTDFAIMKLTPEERKMVLAEWQGGLLDFEEARNQLRQSGIAYKDDKEAKASIDLEMQSRVNLDEGGDNGDGGAPE